MATPILTLQNIDLTFGGDAILEDAEIIVAPSEFIALVGRNGSGKSTLLKIAAGLVEPDDGKRFVQPGATIRYLPQEPDLGGFDTVLAYVEAGLAPGDDQYRAQYLLEGLGLTGSEDPARLSGGEARRAALARVLAPRPDILLLDEPTNHLDLPAIEWLELELAGLNCARVIISHDRRFLSDLTRATVWLDRGHARRLDRGFAQFEAWRDQVLEEEETARHKLDRQIVREEHWVRYGVTARRKRNVRRMGELAALREKRDSHRARTGTVNLQAAEASTSGAVIFEAKGIAKAFGGTAVVEPLDLKIMRGDRLGIIGPNGAGKTTLLKMLTGEVEPDSGEVRRGAGLEVATLDQRRASLQPNTSLKDALTGGGSDMVTINGESRHVISYMKDFLFTPEQAGTALGKLSGGERARVVLARALSLPSNVLVLDEPTNDLDLETLDLLQEMLADYPGTVILVSHDRDFLDRIATSVLAAEGNGLWIEYAGGYSDMVAQRRAARVAASPAAAKPAKPASSGATNTKRRGKLSFKDQHALQTLPARLTGLQDEIAALSERLADPQLFNSDPAAFAKATQNLTHKQRALEAAEEEWLRLELLREELDTPN